MVAVDNHTSEQKIVLLQLSCVAVMGPRLVFKPTIVLVIWIEHERETVTARHHVTVDEARRSNQSIGHHKLAIKGEDGTNE